MADQGFERLARRFHEIARGIEKAVDKTIKDAASQALFNVVYETPVDVGTARSNWQVGLGGGFIGSRRPAYSPIPSRWRPTAGTNPGGSRRERANMFAAINAGKAKIRLRTRDEDIYITNHLPYIARLNEGHSRQTAPGFVRRAVLKAAGYTTNRAVYHLRRELR